MIPQDDTSPYNNDGDEEPEPTPLEREGPHEEIDLNAEEEAALDAAWAEMVPRTLTPTDQDTEPRGGS